MTVQVHGEFFTPRQRQAYIGDALRVAEALKRRRLLFFDPDTGIEPGTLKPEHASLEDIAAGWKALEQGEVLAVYQHAAHEPNWIARSILRMAGTCPGGDVRSIVGNVAGDVSILWAVKEAL